MTDPKPESPLQALNRINGELNSQNEKCDRKTKAQESLANRRNSSDSLIEIIEFSSKHWRFAHDEIAKEALHRAVNKYKLEIIRLAELDLQLQAREHKINSKMLEDRLSKSILPSK